MGYTTEQKFKALCQITRASHFEWRETFRKMYPDQPVEEAVMKYWEVVGQDTAKAYLRKIDPDRPIGPQIAQMIVNSSLAMGENATIESEENGEVRLVHAECPWYGWHKKYDALDEDRPGCDCWFQTLVKDINQALSTKVSVETVSSLPDGDDTCTRIFREN